METDKIELKTSMMTEDVAEYLLALAQGFKTGSIVVEKGEERLVLDPAALGLAEVEIEARLKKGKAKFSLELSWRIAEAQEEGAEFVICSAAPKAEFDAQLGCDAKVEAKAKDEVTAEVKKAEDRKLEEKAPEAPKAADQKSAPEAPKSAAAPAKSDVKPAAPAVNEPGGKAAVAANAQAKPKA